LGVGKRKDIYQAIKIDFVQSKDQEPEGDQWSEKTRG